MRGLIHYSEYELSIIAGTIVQIYENDNRLIVGLQYDIYDPRINMLRKQITWVSYWNQTQRDDNNPLKEYADLAKQKHLKVGEKILTTVKFREGYLSEAHGYYIKYQGIMSLKPSEFNELEDHVSAISGTVSWIDQGMDKGKPYLRIGMYVGKDKYKNNKTVYVYATTPEMINRVRTYLMPYPDGSKKKPIIKCGKCYIYNDEQFHREIEMYQMEDFTL